MPRPIGMDLAERRPPSDGRSTRSSRSSGSHAMTRPVAASDAVPAGVHRHERQQAVRPRPALAASCPASAARRAARRPATAAAAPPRARSRRRRPRRRRVGARAAARTPSRASTAASHASSAGAGRTLGAGVVIARSMPMAASGPAGSTVPCLVRRDHAAELVGERAAHRQQAAEVHRAHAGHELARAGTRSGGRGRRRASRRRGSSSSSGSGSVIGGIPG